MQIDFQQRYPFFKKVELRIYDLHFSAIFKDRNVTSLTTRCILKHRKTLRKFGKKV